MTTDWPDGNGSSEYDFLSPKLLNEDHDWGGGAVGWNGLTGNAEYIIRKGVIWLSLLGGKSGSPDLFLTNGSWYAEYRPSSGLSCRTRSRLTLVSRTR